jgi:hypothetical protein
VTANEEVTRDSCALTTAAMEGEGEIDALVSTIVKVAGECGYSEYDELEHGIARQEELVGSHQVSETPSKDPPLTESSHISNDISADNLNGRKQDLSPVVLKHDFHGNEIMMSSAEKIQKKEASEALSTILNRNEVAFSSNDGKGYCMIFSLLQGINYPNRVRRNMYHEAARAMRLVKTSKNVKLLSSDAQAIVHTWSDELIEKVFLIKIMNYIN